MSAPLTLVDIVDHRAYEAERADFRAHIIALKARRRVGVGPFVTFLFENRDTMRFQIQEVARAERMMTDAAIQVELDTYNPLLPSGGELSATMFLELTSEGALREWLPRLVGVERCVGIMLANGVFVPALLEAAHAAQLTRDDTTSCVHYIRFGFDPEARAAFGEGASLCVRHPEYLYSTDLSSAAVAELLGDLAQ